MELNFNGKDLGRYFVVTSDNRPMFAPSTFTQSNVPGSATAVISNRKSEPYSVDYEIKIIKGQREKEDLREHVRVLGAILRGSGKLIHSDDPDVYYNVEVSGRTELEEIVNHGFSTLTFFYYDPYPYSHEVKETKWTADERELHETLFLSHETDMHYMPSVSPSFEFVMMEAVEEYRIEHRESGKKVLLLGGFSTGDVVEVNASRKIIKVNGNIDMTRLAIVSRFFSLYPGQNTLALSGGASEGKMKYQKQFY